MRVVRRTGTYECQCGARTKNYLNTISTRRKTDLAKMGQVVSMFALLAHSLGFCWGDYTCSCPLACACTGLACILARHESRVVMVVTVSDIARCGSNDCGLCFSVVYLVMTEYCPAFSLAAMDVLLWIVPSLLGHVVISAAGCLVCH